MKRRALSLIICSSMLLSQAPFMTNEASAQVENSMSVKENNINQSFNAVVDGSYTGDNGKEISGVKTYNTLSAAIESVPSKNTSEFKIFIKNGTYKEKITITKPNVTLIGESAEKTILTYDAAAGQIIAPEFGGDGTSTYQTGGSSTIRVTSKAKNFAAANLTMENSFDEIANASMKNKQALALFTDSDKSTYVNCRFIGNQDTLCAYTGKQYYYNCYIEGDVDFIFGKASAVFEKCEIYSVDRQGIKPKGYITAPNTLAENEFGYLFLNCDLTSNITEPGTVYLGRPWHPGDGVNSSAVFKNCNMGAHISSEGWTEMSGNKPEDNRLYEYGSKGPGAITSDTRIVLSDEEASKYTKENVLESWDTTEKVNELSSYKENTDSNNKPAGDTTIKADNEFEKVKWNQTRFGTTTSPENNTISLDEKNKTITLNSGRKDGTHAGGKNTSAHDGITYYYTAVDASKNFEISADVKVNYFEKEKPDNQAGFGIMARDVLGVENDVSLAASNVAIVGGFKGNVQSVFRNGVTSDFSDKIRLENLHKFYDRPANDGTATYRLTLKKTNTGYIASVDNGEEVVYYTPKQLEVIDKDHVYVGFYTARIASITVSDVYFHTSDAATDPKGEEAPVEIVKPSLNISSPKETGSKDYTLTLNPNLAGDITVLQDGKSIFTGKAASEEALKVKAELVNGKNNFEVKYTPYKSESNNSTETQSIKTTVEYKTYGVENGEVYVSQNGTEDGKGTIDSPIDIYSAVKYTANGQTIKVKGGTYNLTKPLIINDGNDGVESKNKSLVSYDGRAIFDFGKASPGFTLSGDYWHIKDIDVCNTADKNAGMKVMGSHNLVETVKTYNNGDTGLQVSGDLDDKFENWPSYNTILNCDSYDNMDAAMNNADGFAAKISTGEGNVFRGCISHNNCDDGWDLYAKLEVGKIGAVTIENCIAYGNGTLTDGTVTKGDGNGFKLGGEGIATTHTLKNSLAFGNDAAGVTCNSNPAAVVLNSISVDNDVNISLDYFTNAELLFNLKDVISFRTAEGKEDYIPDMVRNESNYFNDGINSLNTKNEKIEASMFKSTVMPTKAYERDNDGNIIWGDYMTLVKGEDNKKPGVPEVDSAKPEKVPVKDQGDKNQVNNEEKVPANDSEIKDNNKASAKTGDAGVLGILGLGAASLASMLKSKKRKK